MEALHIYDIFGATFTAIKAALELNSVFAAEIMELLLKPFSDLSLVNMLAAVGGTAILWRKKVGF